MIYFSKSVAQVFRVDRYRVFVYFAYQIVNHTVVKLMCIKHGTFFSIFISSFVSPKGQNEPRENVSLTPQMRACSSVKACTIQIQK